MNREIIVEKINDFLIEELEIDESLITPEASLMEDLEIESLDFVDIAVLVEEEFGFKFVKEDMQEVRTLDDMYNYIQVNVKA